MLQHTLRSDAGCLSGVFNGSCTIFSRHMLLRVWVQIDWHTLRFIIYIHAKLFSFIHFITSATLR